MALTKVTGDFIKDGVLTVGHLHTSHGITTAHISEGSNLYFTNARVDSRIGDLSTSNLSEGTNLYYTDARVGSYLTTNSYATQSYVNTQVSNLVDSAPSTLDTLNELAAALGDDANFSTTVTNSIATKMPLAGGTFTGQVIFPSAATTKPVLPNGFISRNDLDDTSGRHDIWGISERYYPSNSTTGDAWGIQWSGTPNDIVFVGGGTDRFTVSLDEGNITAGGTITASGGNSTQWNTAYTYSQVGHLPLAGGNMTGAINFDQTNSSGGGDFDFIIMGYNGSWSNNQNGLASIAVNDGTGIVGRYGITYGSGGGRFVVTDLYDGGYGASGDILTIAGNGATNLNGSFAATGNVTGANLNISNWNTAYGWGNHASAGYFTNSGSWLGDLGSYSYTREHGLSMTGGSEFVILSKNGQGTVLVDGQYLSYESANGFFGSYNSAYGNLTGIRASAANTLKVMQLDGGNAILEVTQDARAPIFYDSNNTARYIDPASASSINGLSMNGQLSMLGNNIIVFGPNTGWSKELAIGGNANNSTSDRGSIGITNGNLHIDAANGSYVTYLNFYDGTGGVAFGSGATSAVAWMGPDGDLWKGSSDNSGSKYWHAGNDGSGSGLDADVLDGIDSASFVRSDADDTLSGQYTFTKTNDHAIKVGTIRGTAVGSQTGEFIQMYNRVNIGGPSGWGASNTATPNYGLSTYGGTRLAVYTDYTESGGSMRAPIFYDSNNTNFYLNPASTSNLSILSTDTNEGIFNNQRRNHSTIQNFNDTSLRAGINYLQQGTNGPTGTASHQWYGWRLGLGGDHGTQTGASGHYAQEWYIARKGQGGNNTGGNFLWTRDMESGSWSSWQKIDTDRLQLASGYSVAQGDWGARNTTPHGWIQFGPANTSHAHIYTDRSNFYFNAQIQLLGGSLINQNDIRSQIFYDIDDTGYYANPAGSSQFSNIYYNQWLRNNQSGGSGLYWESQSTGYGWHIYPKDRADMRFRTGAGNGGIVGTIADETARGYIHWTTSNEIGFLNSARGWSLRVDNSGNTFATTSHRAPIFYDSNDTTYYTDPASLSLMYDLTLIGSKHTYLYINPGSGYEAMVRYNGGTGSTWYAGSRTSSDLVGSTDAWHVYSETAGRTVSGTDTAGNIFAYGSVRSPIYYDRNDTAYYLDPASGGKFKGNFEFAASSTGTAYSTASIELRESNYTANSSATPPYIGFHWGGVVASNIAIESNGRIAIRNNPGNAYETFISSVSYASSSFQGPIYYDSNNTAYFTDPGTLSTMHSLKLIEHQNHTPRWDFSCYVLETPHHYSTSSTGNLYVGESNTIYLRTTAISTGDHRAPIFYDYNDTGYYTDPASTSNLNAVTLNYINYKNSNFRVGNSTTMNAITSGGQNVAFGPEALGACNTGTRNFAYGYAALANLTSGSNNIAMGDATGYNVTSGSNNLLFGISAGRTGYQTYQSIAGITTQSNQIHMGNESHTTARIQISWTVNSDARDKTDVTPLDLGLEFVKQLNPVTYRWDKRSDYEDRAPTGANKLPELSVGFLAQEVETVEKSFGYDIADKTNLVVDRILEQDHYGITYEKMVPVLTKAIQEQQTIIDDLKSRIETLENQ